MLPPVVGKRRSLDGGKIVMRLLLVLSMICWGAVAGESSHERGRDPFVMELTDAVEIIASGANFVVIDNPAVFVAYYCPLSKERNLGSVRIIDMSSISNFPLISCETMQEIARTVYELIRLGKSSKGQNAGENFYIVYDDNNKSLTITYKIDDTKVTIKGDDLVLLINSCYNAIEIRNNLLSIALEQKTANHPKGDFRIRQPSSAKDPENSSPAASKEQGNIQGEFFFRDYAILDVARELKRSSHLSEYPFRLVVGMRENVEDNGYCFGIVFDYPLPHYFPINERAIDLCVNGAISTIEHALGITGKGKSGEIIRCRVFMNVPANEEDLKKGFTISQVRLGKGHAIVGREFGTGVSFNQNWWGWTDGE